MSCSPAIHQSAPTELNEALFRVALTALGCNDALLRGEREVALINLEEFRAAARYLEYLCRCDTLEAEELRARGCLSGLHRVELMLIESCRDGGASPSGYSRGAPP